MGNVPALPVIDEACVCYVDDIVNCQVAQTALAVVVADRALNVLLAILFSGERSATYALRVCFLQIDVEIG